MGGETTGHYEQEGHGRDPKSHYVLEVDVDYKVVCGCGGRVRAGGFVHEGVEDILQCSHHPLIPISVSVVMRVVPIV